MASMIPNINQHNQMLAFHDIAKKGPSLKHVLSNKFIFFVKNWIIGSLR